MKLLLHVVKGRPAAVVAELAEAELMLPSEPYLAALEAALVARGERSGCLATLTMRDLDDLAYRESCGDAAVAEFRRSPRNLRRVFEHGCDWQSAALDAGLGRLARPLNVGCRNEGR